MRRAIKTTYDVSQDPEKIMKNRTLPKAGTEPLEFETTAYNFERKRAQERAKRSIK